MIGFEASVEQTRENLLTQVAAIADRHFADGRYAEAERLYRLTRRLQMRCGTGKVRRIWVRIGECCRQQGKRAEALRFLKKACTTKPEEMN